VRTCPVPAGDLGTTDFARVQILKDTVVTNAKAAAVTFLQKQFDLSEYRNTYGRSIAT
jgi:hypothetical protein